MFQRIKFRSKVIRIGGLLGFKVNDTKTLVISVDFGARRLVALRILLAGVAKFSVGAVLRRLEDFFVGEGGERLGFRVRDWEDE